MNLPKAKSGVSDPRYPEALRLRDQLRLWRDQFDLQVLVHFVPKT